MHKNCNPLMLICVLFSIGLAGCSSPTQVLDLGALDTPTSTSTNTAIITATDAPTNTPTTTPAPTPMIGGGRIAFWSDRDGHAGIYVLDVRTNRVTQLVSNLVWHGDLIWSPDGKRIAFTAPLDENYPYGCFPTCRFGLYVMDSDGGNLVGLNEYPGFYRDADWSPDGKNILFISTHDDPHPDTCDSDECNEEIYVMNVESGDITRLTNDPGSESYPAWSPDGKRIAFLSNRVWYPEHFDYVYVMNADGSNVTRLTSEEGQYGSVAWSPDGKRIAFWCAGSGGCDWGISVIDADGGNLTWLPYHDAYDCCPVWSPDGKRIAFSSADGGWEVFVMNADGSQVINVTHNAADDWNPAWSPDGTYIAFDSTRDEPRPDECNLDCNSDIYVTDADGSNIIRLTNDPAHDEFPQWAPGS